MWPLPTAPHLVYGIDGRRLRPSLGERLPVFKRDPATSSALPYRPPDLSHVRLRLATGTVVTTALTKAVWWTKDWC